MTKFQVNLAVPALMLSLGLALPAAAEPFSFSTGSPTDLWLSPPDRIRGANSRSSRLTISFLAARQLLPTQLHRFLTGADPTIGHVVAEYLSGSPGSTLMWAGRAVRSRLGTFRQKGADADEFAGGCGNRKSGQRRWGAQLHCQRFERQFRSANSVQRRHKSQT